VSTQARRKYPARKSLAQASGGVTASDTEILRSKPSHRSLKNLGSVTAQNAPARHSSLVRPASLSAHSECGGSVPARPPGRDCAESFQRSAKKYSGTSRRTLATLSEQGPATATFFMGWPGAKRSTGVSDSSPGNR